MTKPTLEFIHDFLNSSSYSHYKEQVESFNYTSMRDIQDLIAQYKEYNPLSDDDLIEVINLLSPKIG